MGWSHHSKKEDVDILVNARPDGPTWGMGHGVIRATSAAIDEVVEGDSKREKPQIDKQMVWSKLLRTVPHSACPMPEGWHLHRLDVVQELFKPPFVSGREVISVALKMKRASDGAVRSIKRSVDVPGVETPSGAVRANLTCGGLELQPSANGQATTCTYVNMLNPNGYIPKSVVNKLVPDRALFIARVRKVVIP